MKRLLSAVLSVLMVLSAIAMPALASPSPFSDVPPTHWAYYSIVYCHDNNLVNGTGNGQFSPDKTLSYAEFVTMMMRAMDYPNEIKLVYEPKLPSGSSWWLAPLRWAYVHHCLDNTALYPAQGGAYTEVKWDADKVNSTIDRYEMAILVNNALEYFKCDPRYPQYAIFDFEYPSADAIAAAKSKIGDYGAIPEQYREAVAVCVAMGIITGVNDRGDFNGSAGVTRAQAAAILQRCHQKVFSNLGAYAEGHKNDVLSVLGQSGQQTNTQPVTPSTTTAPATTPSTPVVTPATPSTEPDTPAVPATNTVPETPSTTVTSTYKTPNGTRWNKDSVNYPTTGLSSDVPNKNGFCTAALNVDIDPNAMLMYDMLDLINAERAKEGLQPYKWAPYDEFEEFALLRASETRWVYNRMNHNEWTRQFWAKYAPDGNYDAAWDKYYRLVHYRLPGYGGLTEDWAGGNRGSDRNACASVLSQWMNSPGHRKPIMDPHIGDDGIYRQTYIVVAKCDNSWVLEFLYDVTFDLWMTHRCADSGLTFIENSYTESPAAGILQIHRAGE